MKAIVKYTPLTGEKLFLLDAEDVSNNAYGFANCSKLSWSTILFKVTKLGKGVTIKVPKGKKKAYEKLFRKKGPSKKVKIK